MTNKANPFLQDESMDNQCLSTSEMLNMAIEKNLVYESDRDLKAIETDLVKIGIDLTYVPFIGINVSQLDFDLTNYLIGVGKVERGLHGYAIPAGGWDNKNKDGKEL